MRIETGLDRLQHQRIEHLRREVQFAQVLARRPLRRLVGAAVVQVRGQHGAGVRRGIDDAVHEQFDVAHVHARRDMHFALVVGAGQGLGLGDGFHRVGGRGGRVQLDRQQGPGGQFAGLLQAGEGFAVFRAGQRIHETGDALPAHGVEGCANLIEFFRVGGGRHHGGQRFGGAVFADAVRVAGAVASVFAVFGVGGVLVDPGQFQAAGVGQHGVEIGGAHLDRTLGLERVQGRFVGVAVEPGHAHAVPAAHFEPDVRALVLFGIEAGLDACLKLRAGHGLVFQVAQGHGATAIPGVHVCIDEARHQHASGQVDQLCLLADVAVDPGIAADVDDLAT
ncbi:hypothetical protein D3C84_661880 [compost metagenome]